MMHPKNANQCREETYQKKQKVEGERMKVGNHQQSVFQSHVFIKIE